MKFEFLGRGFRNQSYTFPKFSMVRMLFQEPSKSSLVGKISYSCIRINDYNLAELDRQGQTEPVIQFTTCIIACQVAGTVLYVQYSTVPPGHIFMTGCDLFIDFGVFYGAPTLYRSYIAKETSESVIQIKSKLYQTVIGMNMNYWDKHELLVTYGMRMLPRHVTTVVDWYQRQGLQWFCSYPRNQTGDNE